MLAGICDIEPDGESDDLDDESFTLRHKPQCQFFVLRKKRLCRMTVRPGREYCGEHEPQPEPTENKETDLRVPCPNDPKHTCYKSKLQKHLTKCNARKVEEPSYIEHNINAPKDTEECKRIPLKDVPEESLMKVIEKVNTLYEKYLKDTITTFEPQDEHHIAVADDIAEPGRADTSRRHLRQASRLLQLAEEEDLVDDDTCYVELGAGKGMLSYYMGQVWCLFASRVLAVDRAALRHKRDNRVRRGRALRLRADLRHLALHRAPPVAAAAAVVALAKHLCGAATDYAIRCLTADGMRTRTRGALLATCCHHRCRRAAYVGAAALQELGIGDDDLDIMFGIVSWATSGDGLSRTRRAAAEDEAEGAAAPAPSHAADYTIRRITDAGTYALAGGGARGGAARAELGRRAKALLDHGRALFLASKGFRARLCYFVPASESLENLCIVARQDAPEER